MAKLIIPTPLRKYTNQNRTFNTQADNLSNALHAFVEEYPDVEENLLDEEGNVRSYIKLYIGDDEVDPQNNGGITLDEDTEVSIVPAIAGGI
ncbi:molybdopterin synthase subunit MoaD [Fodinibius salinus]|uniref:Molybdopterin synthase subunit MoaD n=1 Tax=Fodinibius salinus TaxID=860790 RepID=A0A5D3YM42_9BACT|nr:MoaD/ThiS family protein [Fodinibius salinus]TYP93767.1 molybdopterin synthase subunit MoaD [Fodinibius salinus]